MSEVGNVTSGVPGTGGPMVAQPSTGGPTTVAGGPAAGAGTGAGPGNKSDTPKSAVGGGAKKAEPTGTPAVKPENSWICPQCGEKNPENAVVCGNCDTPRTWSRQEVFAIGDEWKEMSDRAADLAKQAEEAAAKGDAEAEEKLAKEAEEARRRAEMVDWIYEIARKNISS